MFLVNYRHCQKAVFLELFGNFLLVVVHIDIYVVRAHYVHNPPAVVCNHQRAEGHDAYELASGVLYITGIHRLRIHAHLFYMLHGSFHRPLLFQTDVVGSHQASGTVVRVVEEGVYKASFVLRCFFEDLIYQICRQLLQNIDLIVEVQLVNDIAKLLISNSVYDFKLVIGRQIRENFYGNILRQQSVNYDCTLQPIGLLQQFLKHFSDIRIVIFEKLVSCHEVLFLFQQLKNLFHGFFHCNLRVN